MENLEFEVTRTEHYKTYTEIYAICLTDTVKVAIRVSNRHLPNKQYIKRELVRRYKSIIKEQELRDLVRVGTVI